MYLFIFEDGNVVKSKSYNKDNVALVENELLVIINVDTHQQLFNDQWIDIESTDDL